MIIFSATYHKFWFNGFFQLSYDKYGIYKELQDWMNEIYILLKAFIKISLFVQEEKGLVMLAISK